MDTHATKVTNIANTMHKYLLPIKYLQLYGQV